MDEREVDALLVEKVKGGDLRAFERLVTKYERRIYRLALNILRRPADAEDVTQETFIQAFRSLEAFRGESAFFTWLYRIGMNNSLTCRTRLRQYSMCFEELPTEHGEDGDERSRRWDFDSPSLPLENRQALQQVDAILARMAPPFADALLMQVCEGMSCLAIAKIAAVSPNTVRSRVHRARAFLARELDGRGGAAPQKRIN